jgi:hypothetical protein
VRDETCCLVIVPSGWSVWVAERDNRNHEAYS